jgi:hypothetical protein
MFEKEWFPQAYKIGVGWEEFWKLNPRKIMAIAEGYFQKEKERIQTENYLAYLQGRYFLDALMASVGNMFRNKGQKPITYPQKPYEITEKKELTEEEIKAKRMAFVAQMNALKANFDANKGKGNK